MIRAVLLFAALGLPSAFVASDFIAPDEAQDTPTGYDEPAGFAEMDAPAAFDDWAKPQNPKQPSKR